MHNIILIGFMGSGKTTLGKLLAEKINYTFIDSDQYISTLENKTIPKIFEEKGEPYFRKKEHEFIFHAQLLDKCVISTGAGLPCFENNMSFLQQIGTTIWLNPSENILADRLKKDAMLRPKLQEYNSIEEAVSQLLADRTKYYEQAQFIVNDTTTENLLNTISMIDIKS